MPDSSWPPPQLDPVTLALQHLFVANRELTGRVARRSGMNTTDMSAIGALVLNGPMGPTELAHHLGIRTASATVMIDRLEKAGQVERVRNSDDRRRVTVTETEEARRASQAAWSSIIAAIDEACRTVPSRHQKAVVEMLTRVTEVMRNGEPLD